jgi:thiamine kinase-like enzyme
MSDAELRRALEGFPAGRALLAAGFEASTLAGGLTNRSVRVVGEGVDWVVRLSRGREARLNIDRTHEAQVLALACAHGFAPTVVHVAPAESLLVSAYQPGGTWTRAEAQTADCAARIGARLRALHALELPAGLPVLDLHDVLLHYLELPAPRVSFVARVNLAATVRLAIVGYRPGRPALCHHDLHHLNILAGDVPVFVDWEYAAPGDPALDLAAYAQYHELGEGARAALLAAYGPASGLAPAAFAGTCLLFDCLHALWLDAADAWDSLDEARRSALCKRLLSADPPVLARPLSE